MCKDPLLAVGLLNIVGGKNITLIRPHIHTADPRAALIVLNL